MRIQLYTDGSVRRGGSKPPSCGWGIVALHNDQMFEMFDGLSGGSGDKMKIESHEIFGFLAALKYALEQGFQTSEMSFHTDFEPIAWGPRTFHPENYYVEGKIKLKEWIAKSIQHLGYPASFMEHVERSFRESRFDRVPSRGFCVYNWRADYLAKRGALRASGQLNQPKKFEKWLEEGFEYWDSEREEKRLWFPPFVTTITVSFNKEKHELHELQQRTDHGSFGQMLRPGELQSQKSPPRHGWLRSVYRWCVQRRLHSV